MFQKRDLFATNSWTINLKIHVMYVYIFVFKDTDIDR